MFARLLDEPVGLEALGAHAPPRRGGRWCETSGGSGLSSQRSTTKPRRRPPVSSQWPCPKSLAPMAIRTTPSASGATRLVGDRAVPAPRLEAFVPDVLQRDVPVAGVRRLELEHQRLVGLERERADHVQVVGRGVGVRRARAASAVTRVLGCVSSSGLMVRCSVASLTIVHAIAVNCSAASTSVIGLRRLGVERFRCACVAGCSVSESPTYSRTTIDDASSRDRAPTARRRGRPSAARRRRTPARTCRRVEVRGRCR